MAQDGQQGRQGPYRQNVTRGNQGIVPSRRIGFWPRKKEGCEVNLANSSMKLCAKLLTILLELLLAFPVGLKHLCELLIDDVLTPLIQRCRILSMEIAMSFEDEVRR